MKGYMADHGMYILNAWKGKERKEWIKERQEK